MPSEEQVAELNGLLDQASYLLTTARTAGLSDAENLRRSLKRIAAVLGDADALAASVEAERRAED
jgi:hypothetical protein